MRVFFKAAYLALFMTGLYGGTMASGSDSESSGFESSDDEWAEASNQSGFNLNDLLSALPSVEDQKQDADPVIAHVMSMQLKNEADRLAEILRDKHKREIDALADEAQFPQQKDINELKAKLAEKRSQYKQDIKDRQNRLREKATELTSRIFRFEELAKKYEAAKSEYERYGQSARSQAENLKSKITGHLNQISAVCDELIGVLGRGKEIQERLERFVESIERGDHPSAREIERIKEELDSFVEDQHSYLDRRKDDIESEAEGFNQMVRNSQDEINNLQADLRDSAANANDTGRELQNLQREIDSITGRDRWSVERHNRLVREYNDLLDHYRNQERDFNQQKAECDRRASQLQREINNEQNRVQRLQNEFNDEVRRIQGDIDQRQSEARRRGEELERDINGQIKEQNNELKGIKSTLDSSYGPNYSKIIDGFNALAGNADFDRAAQIFNSISRASDYPKTGEACGHFLAAQLSNTELMNLKRGLDTRLSQLHSLEGQVKGLRSIDSDRDSIIAEEARIKADAEKYQKELDGLVAKINDLYTKMGESADERFRTINEIFKLQAAILSAEVNLLNVLFHIVNAPAHIVAEGKEARQGALDKLRSQHDRGPMIDVIESCKRFDTGSETLPAVCSFVKGAKKSEDLSGHERTGFLKQWFNTLNSNSFFSECTGAICEVFGKEESQVKGFLAGMFVEGFEDNTTVKRVTYDDSGVGYQVTVNGRVFLIDEGGKLLYIDPALVADDFFEYTFTTPANTPEGAKLRELHRAVNFLFGSRWEELKEPQQFSIVYALSLLQLADELQAEQEKAARQEIIEVAEGLISLALGFTPAGPAIGFFEVATGMDVFGNKLSPTQRTIAIGAMAGLHPKVLEYLKKKLGPICKRAFGKFIKGVSPTDDMADIIAQWEQFVAKRNGFGKIPSIDAIRKGDSKRLGSNMLESMGLARSGSWAGYEAHHVIPKEFWNHSALQKVGMDIDHFTNGIFLKNKMHQLNIRSRHYTQHRQYNEAIREALDKIDVSKSVDDVKDAIFKIQSNLRRGIEKGTPLYKKDHGKNIKELWSKIIEGEKY